MDSSRQVNATRSGEVRDTIRTPLVRAFGAIAALALILVAVLVGMLFQVGAAREQVHDDARSMREAYSLALAIREHANHEAHSVIHGNDHQMPGHEAWLEDLHRRAQELSNRVPPRNRPALDRLIEESASLDRVFREEVIPAVLRGDREAILHAHHRVGAHTEAATSAVDALADALRDRMEHAQSRAQRWSLWALGLAVCGALLIIALAFAFGRRLRSLISRPLEELAEAADTLSRGEMNTPVASIGGAEIQVVSSSLEAMRQTLKEREIALVRSERLATLGQVAAAVAHEVNNPIAVIRGYLKTMIPDATGELQEELLILDEEAAACQRFVEDLRSYGRDPSLTPQRTEIKSFLESAADRFRNSDSGETIQLLVDAQPETLDIDPTRLRQVIDNLLLNSANSQAEDRRVELVGTRGAFLYRIEVRDQGEGIPEEHREQIFLPFQTSRSEGSGLGLSIAKLIVEAHGGTIGVQDRARETFGDEDLPGSVFWIELPLVSA